MNEDFAPFELAVKLKEKGFREKCLLHYENTGGFYSNSVDTYDRPNQELDYSDFLKCFNEGNSIGLIDAPTISQVLKWLREEKLVLIGLSPMQEYGGDEVIEWCSTVYKTDKQGGLSRKEEFYYQSYEQAALAGVNYCLDNLI